MDILRAIQTFDGKNVQPLTTWCDRRELSTEDVQELVVVVCEAEGRNRIATTWVLKRLTEKGLGLTRSQTAKLMKSWPEWEEWQANLHLLQMFDQLSIPETQMVRAWSQCCSLVTHENKLVRAWALHGMSHVGRVSPKHFDEALERSRDALSDDSAAVRVRARHAVRDLERCLPR